MALNTTTWAKMDTCSNTPQHDLIIVGVIFAVMILLETTTIFAVLVVKRVERIRRILQAFSTFKETKSVHILLQDLNIMRSNPRSTCNSKVGVEELGLDHSSYKLTSGVYLINPKKDSWRSAENGNETILSHRGVTLNQAKQKFIDVLVTRGTTDEANERLRLGAVDLAAIGEQDNIVKFFGIQDLPSDRISLVSQICEGGSLLNLLRLERVSTTGPTFADNSDGDDNYAQMCNAASSAPIPISRLITWSMGIAQGMVYLQEKNIYRVTLSARDIWLSWDYVAKISLSTLTGFCNQESVENGMGEDPKRIRWTAPEKLLSTLGHVVDPDPVMNVWSFGVLLWEIFSCGQTPYFLWHDDDNLEQNLADFLRVGGRLEVPSDFTPEPIWDIMMLCWHVDRTKRPSFSKIGQKFKTYLTSTYYLDALRFLSPVHYKNTGVA